MREQADVVWEGILHCSNAACQREYPILDGIPLLVPALRSYVTENILPLLARHDLSPELESLIGDCCGPNSPFDQGRYYLSSYAWDHYGDLDPREADTGRRPGSIARMSQAAFDLLPAPPRGPILDIGCAVGRSAFVLAERSEALVLGTDLNFGMLRLAMKALHDGKVRYPRRRVGLVYDRREVSVPCAHPERVDFWACDALALPFAGETFGLVTALNVLDCVRSPQDLLTEVARVLCASGAAALTTPYDWAPAATPVEAWLGGHSQRGGQEGACEPVLRSLLAASSKAQPRLLHVAEAEALPWHVRLHDRSVVEYLCHLVVARREAGSA
jgi:ubiquinone/menaquinone biosynthesis C-methylase UbiE